jgi:hypothetical protein
MNAPVSAICNSATIQGKSHKIPCHRDRHIRSNENKPAFGHANGGLVCYILEKKDKWLDFKMRAGYIIETKNIVL